MEDTKETSGQPDQDASGENQERWHKQEASRPAELFEIAALHSDLHVHTTLLQRSARVNRSRSAGPRRGYCVSRNCAIELPMLWNAGLRSSAVMTL